jgi:hypothetical protein
MSPKVSSQFEVHEPNCLESRLPAMPEISRFYGIRITMNFVDHSPPHFHATYADEEAQVEIATGDVMAGSLPRRAAALVKEWTSLHRAELEANWLKREKLLPLMKIEPLI